MSLPPVRKGYRWIVIETYRNPGEPSDMPLRARPLPGQGIPTHYKVECSEAMRLSHPAGTCFVIEGKIKGNVEIDKCVYTHSKWKYYPISKAKAAKFVAEDNPGLIDV